MVGYNYEGTITNCYASGSVTGGSSSYYLGGLVGYNKYGTINNCYATCSVTGGIASRYLGGLVGYVYRGGISNCYATGSVTGNDDLGGLIGSNSGTITNCYATGTVNGDDDLGVGGLLGYDSSGTISSSYFLDTAGPDNGKGNPLTDAQMQLQSSFVGWDFVYETTNGSEDLWQMGFAPPGYPILYWQNNYLSCDFDLDRDVDLVDLSFFLSHWPDSPCNDSAGDETDWCYGTDLNMSGQVDAFDYNILARDWLKGYVPPPPLPDPNLIAHWKLDESSGSIAYDSTEYQNNGNLINDPNWLPTAGQIDGAIQLNGLDQYIDLGSNPYLEPNLPVTISAWIKLDQIGLHQQIVGLGNHPINYCGVWLKVMGIGDTISCAYGDGGAPSSSSRQGKSGTTSLSTNTWYHVAAVIRGPADMDLYLNGQNDNGTYYGSGGPLQYSTNSCIGSKAGSEEFFHGLIDDTRIYNRALTQPQIQELANLPN